LSVLSIPAGYQYRPRAATNDLKEIVEDSLEELFQVWDTRFLKEYGPLHPRIRYLCEAFLRCGDPHFGFLRVRCVNPACHKKEEKLVPFSCRTRGLCSSCGQRRAIEWAERMVEFVLPFVPYRQVVFTIPIAPRKAFLLDRSLYGELCRVAYAATRDYMRERAPLLARQSRAVPAMVISPQSYGDLIVPNPHCHSAVSLGLFRNDGIYFPLEDIDFSGLEDLFRDRFFEMMLQKEKIRPETVERFKSWEHSGFQADFRRRIDAEDRGGLEGLLSYMERPAVSLRRLRYRDDGLVHYQGTKVHPRLGIDHQLVTPVEFLAMLIPHICLKYEVTMRSYGAISTTFRRRAGWILNPPVHKPPPQLVPAPAAALELQPPSVPSPPEFPPAPPPTIPSPASSSPPDSEAQVEPEFLRKRRRSWARLIAKTFKDDPGICKGCGQPMKIIAAIGPDQPEVIERILRHLHLWDPPWKRVRRARGPPQGAQSAAQPCAQGSPPGPPETIDHVINDELYSVDEIPPEDEG
jgi:hypothetical protein